MLRALTRKASALAPRAEAALGTRSMAMAGMKGERRDRCSVLGYRREHTASLTDAPARSLQATTTRRRPRRCAGGVEARGGLGAGPPPLPPPPPPLPCRAACAMCSCPLPASIPLLLQMLYFKKVGGLDTEGGVMQCCKGTPVGGGGAAAPLAALWRAIFGCLLLSSAEPCQGGLNSRGGPRGLWPQALTPCLDPCLACCTSADVCCVVLPPTTCCTARLPTLLHGTSADGMHCTSADGVALQEDERILRKLLSKVRKSADQVSARPGVDGWMDG